MIELCKLFELVILLSHSIFLILYLSLNLNSEVDLAETICKTFFLKWIVMGEKTYKTKISSMESA